MITTSVLSPKTNVLQSIYFDAFSMFAQASAYLPDDIMSFDSEKMYNFVFVQYNTNITKDMTTRIESNNIGNEALAVDIRKNLKRLDDIGKLERGWNGYGAKGFPVALIDKCKRIISQLSRQPDIYPTGRQSIQVQYELEDRSYLGFEIFEKKTVYLNVPQRKYDKAETGDLTGPDEAEKIERIVSEFYGRSNIGK